MQQKCVQLNINFFSASFSIELNCNVNNVTEIDFLAHIIFMKRAILHACNLYFCLAAYFSV